MSFLWQEETPALWLASRACRDAVAEHTWGDCDFYRSPICGKRLAAWRHCFPRPRAASISRRKWAIKDADFVHLKGILTLYMEDCNKRTITDAAFEQLKGIHTLYMWGCSKPTVMGTCNQPTITKAAFEHLAGTHTLSMSGCKQRSITNATFVHLAGIYTLNMS